MLHKPPSLKLLTCFSEETKSLTPLLPALGARGPAFGIIARNSSDLVEVRTLNFAGCLRSPKGDEDFSLLASASL
ncbi:hypothetical protein VNO80_10219 [Phaseolus coccineus]|uniref:Uncharacterized protein n=1 Tax=Phaseolus coccineus TaxID=3886 RepID=A0AAN9RA96_PHACN